jgi:hypothetical protein
MEMKELKLLDSSEFKVLKQITLISDRPNSEYEIGTILYSRPLTPTYNLKKQEQEDRTTTPMQRLLQEYPNQEKYPHDRIDEIIFDAIKSCFPKSKLRNSTIIFDFDEENLRNIKKSRQISESEMYFSPEFSGDDDIFSLSGRVFKVPRMKLNIYSFCKSTLLENLSFIGLYNTSEEDVLDSLETVTFE